MRWWSIVLRAAGVTLAKARSERELIAETDQLAFPVVIRIDDGGFFLIEDKRGFLDQFELQDLADSSYFGWDSRARSFRFVEQANSYWVRTELGPMDLENLKSSLDDFFLQASELPSWVSGQRQDTIRNWFARLDCLE